MSDSVVSGADKPPWECFEELLEELLQSRGWQILPSRKYNTDNGESVAPMLDGERGKTILPDIYAMKDGRKTWVEAKYKDNGAVYITKDGEYQHGVDMPNWEHYCRIRDETKDEVWLFIYEADTGTIKRQKVSDLSVVGSYTHDDYDSPSAKYDGPMVFFSRGQFETVPVPEHNSLTSFFGQSSLNVGLGDSYEVLPSDDDSGNDDGQMGLGSFSDDD